MFNNVQWAPLNWIMVNGINRNIIKINFAFFTMRIKTKEYLRQLIVLSEAFYVSNYISNNFAFFTMK